MLVYAGKLSYQTAADEIPIHQVILFMFDENGEMIRAMYGDEGIIYLSYNNGIQFGGVHLEGNVHTEECNDLQIIIRKESLPDYY